MKTFNIGLYDLLSFGLGGLNWQSFIDKYNEIYDAEIIDGFDKAPLQLDTTFSQLIANAAATTLPAYVDPESPGYEKALQDVRGAMGNIPTFKAFYSLNRTTLQKRLQLISVYGKMALDGEMQETFLKLIDEATDGLIKGYYNALTHQRMQIVSTGKFVINSTNNPRGLQGIEIGFNIPAANFDALTTTARWWTNATHSTANEGNAADPISYMQARIRYIRNTKHVLVPMHIEMSNTLFDDLVQHSAVQKRIGYYIQPLASSDSVATGIAKNLSDEQIKQTLGRLVGMPIKTYNSVAYVDTVDTTNHKIVPTPIENFKKENIAFVPDGKIGEIQSARILTLGYENDKVATYDGGRLTLSQRANAETHSIYIESESASLCVPSAVNQIFISTVTV